MQVTQTVTDVNSLRLLNSLHALARAPAPIGPTGSGALSGMTVAVKDNIAVAGLPHEGASAALGGHLASEDAASVARLRKAGASVAFQTNMHELAFGITSANACTGAVLNPRDPDRVAGGSSGGTAVAVATGAVHAGLGTDTGGSGRIPAAMCGCAGFRPTTGRYPGDGVLTLSTSLDTVSTMASDVATLARVDAVLSGDADTFSVPQIDKAETVLGIACEPFWSGVSSAVSERARIDVATLQQAGFRTRDIDDPTLLVVAGHVADIALPLVLAEAASFWRAFSQERLGVELEEFVTRIASPDVAGVFSMVAGVADDPESLHKLIKRRDAARQMMDVVFERHGIDALVHPAGPTAAPTFCELSSIMIDGVSRDTFSAFTEVRLMASVTATPALALPTGLDATRLPCALELLGRAGTDRHLLGIALAAEASFDRLPPLS